MPISIRAGGVGGLALTGVVWAVPVASDDGLPPLSELCAAVVVAADRKGVDLGRLLQLESLPEVMPDDEWQECRIAVFAHMNAGFRGAMREAEREAMEFQREVEARQRAERAHKIAACQSSGGEWRDRAAGSYCVPREQVEARKRALEEMEHRRAERVLFRT